MTRSDDHDDIELVVVVGDDNPASPFRTATSDSLSGAPGGLDEDDQRRWALVAGVLAVGVLAAIGVWFSVFDSSDEPESASLPTVAGSTTTAPALAAMPAVVPELGAAGRLEVSQVGLPGPLGAQQIEIVAFGNGRRLFRLDLGEALLGVQEIQRHPFGRADVVVGPDWIVMPTTDEDDPALVIDRVGNVQTAAIPLASSTMQAFGDDSVWVVTSTPPDLSVAAELVGLDGGSRARARFEMPSLGRDPLTGGLVLQSPAGVDAWGPDRFFEQLTDAPLLALGARHVVSGCEPSTDCSLVVHERESGVQRLVSAYFDDGSEIPRLTRIGTESVDVAGLRALVEISNPQRSSDAQAMLGVVDLITGEVTDVGRAQRIELSRLTPDGRFVIYLNGGRVVAFDTETRSTMQVSESLVAIEAFGIRPSLGDQAFDAVREPAG